MCFSLQVYIWRAETCAPAFGGHQAVGELCQQLHRPLLEGLHTLFYSLRYDLGFFVKESKYNWQGGDVKREERSDEPERQLGFSLCEAQEKVRAIVKNVENRLQSQSRGEKGKNDGRIHKYKITKSWCFPFIMYNLQCQEEHICDRRLKARAGECLDSLWMHLSGQFIRFSVKHFFGNLYWKRTSTKQDPGPRSYPRVSFLLEPKSWSDKIFSPSPSSWALTSFVVSHKIQIMDQLNLSCFHISPFEISRLFSSKWWWCRVRFTCWSLFIGILCI